MQRVVSDVGTVPHQLRMHSRDAASSAQRDGTFDDVDGRALGEDLTAARALDHRRDGTGDVADADRVVDVLRSRRYGPSATIP
jgi:hypothetical protein